MKKRIILLSATILLAIVSVIIFIFYQKIFGESTIKSGEIFIRSNANLDSVIQVLNPYLKNKSNFIFTAKQKKYQHIKPGRYLIEKGMSNNTLVNLLRSGKQTPVLVTFNNQNTLKELANRIAEQLEVDKNTLLNSFTNPEFLAKNNFTEKTILGMFLPNSYEFYWNTSGDNFRNKILEEWKKFWTKSRLEKAKKINLTPNEVITLASIVQKEDEKNNERAKIAGLYLNRLQKKWPLEADPTIVYAIKQEKGSDFIVKRVLKKDTQINSPYNTYKNVGLPPSLIAMPDISSIEAVLNAEKHNYMFMCASVEDIGFHEFATSLNEHLRNARKYQKWMNSQQIYR